MIKLPLKEKQAFLITDRLTRKYICKFDLEEGFLLVGNKTFYLTDARYFYRAKPIIEQNGITAVLFNDYSDIKKLCAQLKLKTLFIDFERTMLSQYQTYKSFKVKLKDGSEILNLVKTIKNEEELSNIQKACEITQTALWEEVSRIKEGITELELKKSIENKMISLGADGVAFDTIVAFGANSAVPHHLSGETKLCKNSVVLIDAGCKVNGYCSDITRTYFFGEPTKKFINVYQSVYKANELALREIKSGVNGKEADDVARKYLSNCGFGEKFTHSLGHGVGLEIHEFPSLSKKSSALLKDGMVFTIEPGVYLDGEFGVRIEDTVVLKNGSVERLFTDRKDLILL